MAEIKKIIVDGTEYSLPEGGGSSQVFVDVDSLPTENINSDVIYRLFKVFGIFNQYIQINTTVHIVDSLPTTGENCTNGSELTVMYYNKSDENVYGYVDDTIASAFGITAGWYPASALMTIANLTYGGIVDSIVGLEENTYYFVREYDFYIYKGKWIKLDNDIVFQGEGSNSVVMNDLGNVASGNKSIAEGSETTASGSRGSHAEGHRTTASGDYGSHAEGYYTTSSGNYGSHAEGYQTTASGDYGSYAEGNYTTASGDYGSHAEGHGATYGNIFTFTRTSTQYQYTSTSTFKSGVVLTDQNGTYAKITAVSGTESPYTYTLDKDFVTTEGETVSLYQVVGIAYGRQSHAEGNYTTSSGNGTHAEGEETIASGNYSHAEGSRTTTSSDYSHAEGSNTTASGLSSHAEGSGTKASGNYSHAEGSYTKASSNYSHAEGSNTTASGSGSHAEGYSTIAASPYQHAQGKYNIEDSSETYAHIVGNGSSSARSNAHTLDWSGNAWFKGKVRVGGTSWDDATELGSSGGGGGSETIVRLDSLAMDVVKLLTTGSHSRTATSDEKVFFDNIIERVNNGESITSLYVSTFNIPFIGYLEDSLVFGVAMEVYGDSALFEVLYSNNNLSFDKIILQEKESGGGSSEILITTIEIAHNSATELYELSFDPINDTITYAELELVNNSVSENSPIQNTIYYTTHLNLQKLNYGGTDVDFLLITIVDFGVYSTSSGYNTMSFELMLNLGTGTFNDNGNIGTFLQLTDYKYVLRLYGK